MIYLVSRLSDEWWTSKQSVTKNLLDIFLMEQTCPVVCTVESLTYAIIVEGCPIQVMIFHVSKHPLGSDAGMTAPGTVLPTSLSCLAY